MFSIKTETMQNYGIFNKGKSKLQLMTWIIRPITSMHPFSDPRPPHLWG